MSLIANAALNSPSDHIEGQFNPAGHDMVNELLSGVRLRGLDYRRIEISAPFGLRFGEDIDDGRAWFHFIGLGTVHLRTRSGAVHVLGCGDAVLLPCAGIQRSFTARTALRCAALMQFEKGAAM